MNRYIIYILIAFLVFFASCEKESYINFGFDSPISKDSEGMLVVEISQSHARLFLSGYVRLSEGQLDIILVNPDGVAVFSKSLVAPDEVHVNEPIEASRGKWQLKYISLEGKGYIDLHISNF